MYERSINYIDYFENNVRVKNIGFLKWESNGKNHTIQMKITGLSRMESMTVEMKTEDGKVLESIHIREGRGELFKRYEGAYLGVDKIPLHCINNLYMKFTDYQSAIINWKMDMGVEEKKQYNVSDKNVILNQVRTKAEQVEKKLSPEVKQAEKKSLPEVEQTQIQEPFYEDKWEQLCHTYKVIHPFRGGQDYLSITPKEFVIFREPYQKLVNNSFLLHGYYNYRHIIVGKMRKSGQEVYYLGVPGIYYDREKMAAEVFGFEGFESVEKEITNGSFGYYLRRVEL